jgi:hypothetical protein
LFSSLRVGFFSSLDSLYISGTHATCGGCGFEKGASIVKFRKPTLSMSKPRLFLTLFLNKAVVPLLILGCLKMSDREALNESARARESVSMINVAKKRNTQI